MELFITCGQGLELILAEELGTLGYGQGIVGFRGVKLKNIDLEAIYRINYLSRLAGRVLLPLSRFRCTDARSLYQGASKIDWMAYIPPDKTFAIDANVCHEKLTNSLFAAQVVKDAIVDQIRERSGDRPSVSKRNPDVQVNLFIYQDFATISFDTSGESLHKRGYREESVEAPIQETLAAHLLTIAGFNGKEILCDPCCGSGTFLIEAAMIATNIAPGFLRKVWGFQNHPRHSPDLWLKIKAEIDSKRIPLPKGLLFGIDINKQAFHATKVNLRAAGFNREVEIINADFRDFEPKFRPTFVISNPPHGNRIGDVDYLRPLYRSLGSWMKGNTARPAKGFVFTTSPELAKEVGLAPSKRHVLESGGIEGRLLEYDFINQ